MRILTPVAVAITVLKASVKINDVEVTGCPDTTQLWAPTRTRAHLIGSFFNADGLYNGQMNDVLAYVIITRMSDSTHKPQVLQIFAEVVHCADPGCYNVDFYESVELGKIMLGQWANIEVVWDQAERQFIFRLDPEAPVSIPYEFTDCYPPAIPLKYIGISQRFPYCPVAGREAFLDADSENIFVKESAVP